MSMLVVVSDAADMDCNVASDRLAKHKLGRESANEFKCDQLAKAPAQAGVRLLTP